ncbi:hypothetical protein D3C80_775870 [compost metagenome]
MLVGHAIPFRAANGAEQDRIGGKRLFHIRIGNSHAMGVVGRAADEAFRDSEAGIVRAVHIIDQLADLGHGFGADTVTGQQEKRTDCHENPPWAARRKTSRRVFGCGERGVKLVSVLQMQSLIAAGRDRGLLISASTAFQAKQKPIRYGLVRDRLF